MALAFLLGAGVMAGEASAQAYGPGPAGIPRGSSMSGLRIDGAPPPPVGSAAVPNARLYGDEAAERAYGRAYDDSYTRPNIPRGIRGATTNEERATAGRAGLEPLSAGAYARQGPRAIGRSAITRGLGIGSLGSRGGRARIVDPN